MLHAHPRAAVAIPLPKRLPKDVRSAIEAAIEQHQAAMTGLIALLDAFDGDTDLEPALGYSVYGRKEDDLEGGDVQDEPHDEDDEGNNEPSLAHSNDLNQETARRHTAGSALHLPRGTGWVHSADGDFEAEHDGREPEAHT
jgi:hypothetical protein